MKTEEALQDRVRRLEIAVAEQRRLALGILESVFWCGFAAPFALALVKFPRPDSPLWEQLFNLLHVLLSGVSALIALRLSRRLLGSVLESRFAHYLVSGATATIIGVGLEVAQYFGPGDPSLIDVVRDALGAFAALILARSFDPDWPALRIRRQISRMVSAALLLIALIPSLHTGYYLWFRRATFPNLANFDSRWDQRSFKARNGARLWFVESPREFSRAGGMVAKVVFTPGNTYPKAELTEVAGNWENYRALKFDVYSPAPAPVPLNLKVNDYDLSEKNRFDATLEIAPGQSTISVPVESIQFAPQGRSMDMRSVQTVHLFMSSPSEPVTLYFDNVRLE